jgi:hypothetical protein
MKKTSAVALAVILSSLVFSQTSSATANPPGCDSFRSKATSCTTTYWSAVSVTAFIPCLNHGKGENVTFNDTQTIIFYYTLTNGKRNGFLMHVGGTSLTGRGQTTGIHYTALGSTQDSIANWVPANPDGSMNGDGDFSYTDNYYVNSTSPGPVTNQIWHRTQRFTISNNGITETVQPDEVVCK